jgi:hypothetical protein
MRKKERLRKYIGDSLMANSKIDQIIYDNIDLDIWEKNMKFLEDGIGDGYPLISTIINGGVALPSFLWPGKDRNWFIAAYPDIVIYFWPEVDLQLSEKERINRIKIVHNDIERLDKYLDEQKYSKAAPEVNQFFTLLYIRNFYKDVLKKDFLLVKEDPNGATNKSKLFLIAGILIFTIFVANNLLSSNNFKCPEDYPSQQAYIDDLNNYIKKYIEKNPNKTVEDLLSERYKQLVDRGCTQTLVNIENY